MSAITTLRLVALAPREISKNTPPRHPSPTPQPRSHSYTHIKSSRTGILIWYPPTFSPQIPQVQAITYTPQGMALRHRTPPPPQHALLHRATPPPAPRPPDLKPLHSPTPPTRPALSTPLPQSPQPVVNTSTHPTAAGARATTQAVAVETREGAAA
jgi:hypothetical protein